MFLNGTIRFVVAYFNGLGVQIRKRQLSNTGQDSRVQKHVIVDGPLEKSDKLVDFKRTHANIFTIAQDAIWSGEKH